MDIRGLYVSFHGTLRSFLHTDREARVVFAHRGLLDASEASSHGMFSVVAKFVHREMTKGCLRSALVRARNAPAAALVRRPRVVDPRISQAPQDAL